MKDWRAMIGKRQTTPDLDWRFYLHTEFVDFMDEVAKLAHIYNWNLWGGKVNNYAVCLAQKKINGVRIAIKILPPDYKYYSCLTTEINPNNIENSSYKTFIGNNMDEALKYIHTFLNEHDYEPNFDSHFFMGGAYDRYPLAKKWAYEELHEKIFAKEKIMN